MRKVLWVSTSVLLATSGVMAKDIAKVNGRPVTDKDMNMALAGLNEGQRRNFLGDSWVRRDVLEGVINREILAQEGEKLRLDQEPEFNEMISTFRKQALATRLLEKKLSSQLNRSALKKYYDLHKDKFSTDQVHVQQILLADESEAKKIFDQVSNPASKVNFQDLAEKLSKDPQAKNNRGDLGFITQDRFDPDFTQAVFSAKEGEIVGPIRTSYGYHVVKILEKKIGKPLEFDEVELRVADALRQQLIKNYLNSLRKESKIQIDTAALEHF
jgi:parvulin-like peptidyl-prolyl isomerase